MAVILEVSALNKYVRSLLESDPFLNDIAIRGEISNFNRNFKTGHCYFSLIDSKCSVKMVMFRQEADRLSFRPENGMKVVARGRVSLFERDGAFQFYADALFQDGQGEQKSAFDLLKEKLLREGLFAPQAKKPVPNCAWDVGVISSKTGAALQDIINVVQRRNPCARLVLAPVRVQGAGAAGEAEEALRLLDSYGLDVIVIARGGGSSEDLAVFNDENLARAVFKAETPVVSAIGHEIDFTILDFVADLRAPTPSAAAELVTADLRALLREKEILCMNRGRNIQNRLQLCYNTLYGFGKSPVFRQLAAKRNSKEMALKRLGQEIKKQMQRKIERTETGLQEAVHLAGSLNPYGVVARGYAVVKKQGQPVSRVAQLHSGDELCISLRDGEFTAEVKEIQPGKEGAGA